MNKKTREKYHQLMIPWLPNGHGCSGLTKIVFLPLLARQKAFPTNLGSCRKAFT